tara:strand:- start:229 stop:585 length:357 start_codon:yes stop_codon:yes gene_type:complete
MRTIFKIGRYNEGTNSISVKFCRLHSTKSIDDYSSKLVSCDDLDVSTCESFVKSLMEKSGSRRITKEEEGEPILDSNKSEIITGNLNINDLVGKVIEANVEVIDPRNRFMLSMRKVEL